MKVGLTLGKFAPLHRGHQRLIETAIAETDHVLAIVYDAPQVTDCPLPIRANWIRQLYPSVEVVEAWDGPTAVSDDPKITKMHDEYLKSVTAGRKITHFYSSEFYGRHVSLALGAVDRRVDPDRRQAPISGTQIRQDPYRHRQYLEPLVYRDLITKVVLLGAPCTGKTTLAERLAEHYQTTWMPEYGREYWADHQVDRQLTLEQLVEIAQEHRRREEQLSLQANRYLFLDTDATTTHQFSIYYHGQAHPVLVELAADTLSRYDLFLLCQPDIPYEDTADRSGEVHRQIFQRQIEADLGRRNIPFIRVAGRLEERIQFVERILGAFNKFDSIADRLAIAASFARGTRS